MFAVVGLSHHTAPIEVREQIALSPEKVPILLAELVEQPEVAEVLVLSTCNRVEIVACGTPGTEAAQLSHALQNRLDKHAGPLGPYLYHHLGAEGLEHLFRVAASLDSLVVGEPQILGQLKAALELAEETGTVGPGLRRITTHAVRAAKRVRTETALGVGQVSVPSVAVDLTRRIFGELRGRKAALLGLGEMGQLVAKQLGSEGADLIALGRNPDKVRRLSEELGASPRSLDELEVTLAEVDVLIAMTGAQNHVVTHAMVKGLRKQRRGRALFLVDLSVPRNVDPNVDKLEDTFLYNIDHLQQIVQQSKSSRQGEAERARRIVHEETLSFERAATAEQVTPTIVALRRSLREALRGEHERSQRGKLKGLSEADHQAIERMLDAAVNKILHQPTIKLREAASQADEPEQLDTLVNALTDLFELNTAEQMDRLQSIAPLAHAVRARRTGETLPPPAQAAANGGRLREPG